MKRYTKLAVILLIFLGCTEPQIEEPDFVKKPEPVPAKPNYFEPSSDSEYDALKGGLVGKPFVEYYSATWCGYCKQQSPIIKELSNKHKTVSFLKIDVDQCPKTTKVKGVASLPTTIVNGKKFIGLTNSSVLEQEILK